MNLWEIHFKSRTKEINYKFFKKIYDKLKRKKETYFRTSQI